jgi:hypothetical protein
MGEPPSASDPQPRVERRRHARHAVAERATVRIGPTTLVFGAALDWSPGGTCLRLPHRFAVQVGEMLNLVSERLSEPRLARVVEITDGSLHCAFEPDPAGLPG